MPASASIRSGGIRDVWKGQPTSVGQLGAATLVADLSRSVKAITDAYKMTALLGGSSPLTAFKGEALPLMDLSRSYANAKDFAFAGALTEKTNGIKGLLEAKGILHDLMATRKIAAGLADVFPASSFVAQLPRHPLPLSSRTFYGSPLQIGAIDRLPLREIALLRTRVQMPSLQPLSSAFSLLREWERSQLFFEAVAAVASEWEGKALWFVLSSLPMGRLRSLAGRDREQVEEAVLRALEAVVAEGEFVPALREVLEQAPISDFQRANLIHGLELVEGREYVLAVLPLLGGLQGAIYRIARERSVIDAKRRLLSNPGKRAHGVNTVVREMQLADEGFSKFLHHVFDTEGNAYRHGDAEGSERRRALLAIVALCGWMDAFMGLSARDVLVDLLGEGDDATCVKRLVVLASSCVTYRPSTASLPSSLGPSLRAQLTRIGSSLYFGGGATEFVIAVTRARKRSRSHAPASLACSACGARGVLAQRCMTARHSTG